MSENDNLSAPLKGRIGRSKVEMPNGADGTLSAPWSLSAPDVRRSPCVP